MCRKLLHRASRWPKKEVPETMMQITELSFAFLMIYIPAEEQLTLDLSRAQRDKEVLGKAVPQQRSWFVFPSDIEGAMLGKPDAFFGKSMQQWREQ